VKRSHRSSLNGKPMPIGDISFKLDSPFLRELVKRQIEFKSAKPVAYKIVVPEDLKWWYWLEFGTAGRQDADAPYKTSHSGTYSIDPVNAKALHFEVGGKSRFAVHVDHPGIRPRLIYRSVRTEILDFAKITIAGSLKDGVCISSLRTALAGIIMPYALKRMGDNLEAAAPGVKTSNNNPFK